MLGKSAIMDLASEIKKAKDDLLWASFMHAQLMRKVKEENAPINESGELTLEQGLAIKTAPSSTTAQSMTPTATVIKESDLSPEALKLANATFPVTPK